MNRSFTFRLTREQVDHLIAMKTCVSTDDARPTLTTIELNLDGNEMRAVGTDSYRLGVLTTEVDKFRGDGTIAVNHAKLVRALRWLRADLNYEFGRQVKDQRFIVVVKDDELTVTGSWEGTPKFTVRDRGQSYPKWQELFKGYPWRASEITKTSAGRIGLDGMAMPSFNPRFLAEFKDLIGPANDLVSPIASFSHLAKEGVDASLQPWCLSWAGKRAQVTYLIMPVRAA